MAAISKMCIACLGVINLKSGSSIYRKNLLFLSFLLFSILGMFQEKISSIVQNSTRFRANMRVFALRSCVFSLCISIKVKYAVMIYRGFPGKVSKFGTTRDFPEW